MSLTLEKKKSFKRSNQMSESTCWAHSAAKLISRYLRILYSDLAIINIEEDKECDILFNTIDCLDIFSCILNKPCKSQNIINSAILFNLIYKILTEIYPKCALSDEKIKKAVKQTLQILTRSTQEDLIAILEIQKRYKVNKQIVDGIAIVFSIIEHFKVSPQYRYYYFKVGQTIDVKLLKKILGIGYYAIFTVDVSVDFGHAMIIDEYDENDDDYSIKNSWGCEEFVLENISSTELKKHDNNLKFNAPGNKAPSSMFYDSNDKLVVSSLHFIVPDIVKTSLSCSGGKCFPRSFRLPRFWGGKTRKQIKFIKHKTKKFIKRKFSKTKKSHKNKRSKRKY